MDDRYWQIASELANSGKGFCLVLIAESSGSVPRRAGASMLVDEDGRTYGTIGGGDLERSCADEAVLALKDGKPRLRNYNLNDPEGLETGSICGGSATMVFHPHMATIKAHILGAGHVARSTVHLLSTIGYHCIVYDEGSDFANTDNFPDAGSFAIGDLVDSASNLNFGPRDAVILLAASHEAELEILRTFKDRLPFYLGVIASRKKVKHFQKLLSEDGWSKEDFHAIHAPIGLDIGARTPEEIAVSIVAEIIQSRGPVE